LQAEAHTMPIYAYRCTSCGHAQDVLQRISDPLLTVCPACGASAFAKQVTAAGFQLKGSGWYVTDFKGGSSAPAKKDEGAEAPAPATAEPAAKPAAEPAVAATAPDKAVPTKAPAAEKASPAAAPAAKPSGGAPPAG
jgi:putative FmdB family regulatory protein